MKPLEIIKQFRVSGSFSEAHPFGNGHINDTFRVRNIKPNQPDYVLQRVNTNVFPEANQLMENQFRVIRYIRHQKCYSKLVPELIQTHSGAFFAELESGHWRLYRFVEDANSFDRAQNEHQAWEGGFAFGSFLKALENYPAEKIHTVIPDFHNMESRVQQFDNALKAANPERIEQAQSEIATVQYRYLDRVSAYVKTRASAIYSLCFKSFVTTSFPRYFFYRSNTKTSRIDLENDLCIIRYQA